MVVYGTNGCYLYIAQIKVLNIVVRSKPCFVF